MAALDSGDFNSDASNMNKNDVRPPEAFIQLNKVAYASQYSAYFYDSDSTTDVYTATRLSVTRPIDSSNSCKDDEPNKGQYFPSSGTLPGSTDGQNGVHQDKRRKIGGQIVSVLM